MIAMLRRIVNIGDDILIAGALAATVAAIVAALALFVMFGRLSHRRAEAGVPPSTSHSLPASQSAGTVGGDRS